MKSFLAMRFSTSARRCRAARGLRNGLYCDGAWGSPASSAASGRVSSLACLLKKVSAAASMPMAVRPSTVPNGTSLR